MGSLWLAGSVLFASALSFKGYRKNSLSWDGAIAAFFVGLITAAYNPEHWEFPGLLMVFFVTSSALTKWNSAIKSQREHGHKKGGQRTYVQVLSNSLPGTISLLFVQEYPVAATAAFLAHYACCMGDTWASEVGIVSASMPRYVLAPWKEVPPGTNGGVTMGGTYATVAAGIAAGVSFAVLSAASTAVIISPVSAIAIATCAAFFGSILDSVMGCLLQLSYWDSERKIVLSDEAAAEAISKGCPGWAIGFGRNILDNHQVNLASSAMTSLIAFAWMYSVS